MSCFQKKKKKDPSTKQKTLATPQKTAKWIVVGLHNCTNRHFSNSHHLQSKHVFRVCPRTQRGHELTVGVHQHSWHITQHLCLMASQWLPHQRRMLREQLWADEIKTYTTRPFWLFKNVLAPCAQLASCPLAQSRKSSICATVQVVFLQLCKCLFVQMWICAMRGTVRKAVTKWLPSTLPKPQGKPHEEFQI